MDKAGTADRPAPAAAAEYASPYDDPSYARDYDGTYLHSVSVPGEYSPIVPK